MSKKRIAVIAPLALVGMVGVGGLLGLLIASLWNALMPPIFGLPEIGFWQALGLFVLGRLLFGRFGMGGQKGGPRFVRGWKHLTPEQRQRFREAMEKCNPENPDDSIVA